LANAGQGPRLGWKADSVMKRKLKKNPQQLRPNTTQRAGEQGAGSNSSSPSSTGVRYVPGKEAQTKFPVQVYRLLSLHQQGHNWPSPHALLRRRPRGVSARRLSGELCNPGETQPCPARPGQSARWSLTTARPVSPSPPASAGDHQRAESGLRARAIYVRGRKLQYFQFPAQIHFWHPSLWGRLALPPIPGCSGRS